MNKQNKTSALLRQWGLWEREKDDTTPDLGYPKKSAFYRHGKEYVVEHVAREPVTLSDDEAIAINRTVAQLPRDLKRAVKAHYLYAPFSARKAARIMKTSRRRAALLLKQAQEAFKLEFSQNNAEMLENA